MKLLGEISEKSLGISQKEILGEKFIFRKSARAILLNDKNEVSLQHVGKWDYYKLPGGGVETGESIEEALRREILEEVGCEIEIENEIGVVIEFRNSAELLHLSYAFIARVKGEIGQPKYEQAEIDNEFEAIWVTLDEAIDLLEKHCPENPDQAPFIVSRESIFLKEAKRILK